MIKIIDEKECKLPGWFCKQDAGEKSDVNIELFTDEQIRITRELHERASDIYTFKGIYTNFRKNKSVVKLDHVYGEPTSTEAALALAEWAKAYGFEKVYIRGSHSIKFTAPRV